MLSIDVPKVAMSHGNSLGDADFEIVMPNGKICPTADHGLPTYNVTDPVSYHGITEVDGVIYLCGGEFSESDESSKV